MVFAKLRVWDTEDNNGVLIYVELADHRIEIVADRGIARHVPNARWEEVSKMMRERFQAGEFEAGSIAAVRAVSAILAERFRLADGARNPNQLSDAPTVLRPVQACYASSVRSSSWPRPSDNQLWRTHYVDRIRSPCNRIPETNSPRWPAAASGASKPCSRKSGRRRR